MQKLFQGKRTLTLHYITTDIHDEHVNPMYWGITDTYIEHIPDKTVLTIRFYFVNGGPQIFLMEYLPFSLDSS